MAPMTSGDDAFSYVNNSTLQRDGLTAAKEAIEAALIRTLDLKNLLNGSATFTIADLGCSTGPNTFLAIQAIVETVRRINSSFHGAVDPNKLQFQALLNDLPDNDFNTLLLSLPKWESCYVAAVPGSFYGRLFPRSSVHVAYTSSSLHWLSAAPSELQARGGPAWNPGRIHYTGAHEAVVRAYERQYEEDVGVFLAARAEEVATGGVMVVIMPGVPDLLTAHDVGIAIDFLGSILMDMVNEGLLNQDLIDAFNFPHMYPSVEQMRRLVEKNGCFESVKMELRNARPEPKAPIDMEGAIMHLRAIAQGSIAAHFGTQIVDQLFKRAFDRKNEFAHMLHSSGIEIGSQLFAVLKRK